MTETSKFMTPGKVKTINGSITIPENAGLRFILNPCSLSGKWDSKLQKLISKKWMKPQLEYKSWHANTFNFKLGQIQTVAVQSDIWIVNFLTIDKDGKFDQKAFDTSLKAILKAGKDDKASMHVSTLTSEIHNINLTKYSEVFSPQGVHIYFYNGDDQ